MRQTLCWCIALLALTSAAPAPEPLAAQMSADEVATVDAEVRDAVETYYRLFSERKMEALPQRVFHIPWVVIGGGGVRADMSEVEALSNFRGSLVGLLERGWDRSVFTVTNVCVLNSNAAIASGYNTRYHEDGSEMSVGGVSYLFGKTDEGWRIISYTGHDRDRVVRCD